MNNLIAFQEAISITGTAQNLPNYPVNKSITISAKSGNAAPIVFGNSNAVTSTTGFLLIAGTTVTFQLEGGNTNQLWAVGTSADVFSVIGA